MSNQLKSWKFEVCGWWQNCSWCTDKHTSMSHTRVCLSQDFTYVYVGCELDDTRVTWILCSVFFFLHGNETRNVSAHKIHDEMSKLIIIFHRFLFFISLWYTFKHKDMIFSILFLSCFRHAKNTSFLFIITRLKKRKLWYWVMEKKSLIFVQFIPSSLSRSFYYNKSN